MKTLPEILRDAMVLLDDRERVVIARGQVGQPPDGRSAAYQLRLRHDVDMGLSAYRCEARSWLGGQWSDWREHRGWLGNGGFDVDDVLAMDWRIIA